jgi:hypothetical protein
MSPRLIAIVLVSVFVLLVAAPVSIRIGGIVALVTFILGYGVLTIFGSNSEKTSGRSLDHLQWLRHSQTLTSLRSQTADSREEAPRNREMRQMIGVAGSLSLVIGAFTLIYVGRGTGDAIILILLAGVSVFVIATRWYQVLKVCAGLAAVVCLFTWVMLNSTTIGFGWVFLLVGLCCLFATAWYDSIPNGELRAVNGSHLLDPNSDCVEWRPSRE